MTALLPALLIASGSVHGITVYEGIALSGLVSPSSIDFPEGTGPNLDLILARLTGDQIEHTESSPACRAPRCIEMVS